MALAYSNQVYNIDTIISIHKILTYNLSHLTITKFGDIFFVDSGDACYMTCVVDYISVLGIPESAKFFVTKEELVKYIRGRKIDKIVGSEGA